MVYSYSIWIIDFQVDIYAVMSNELYRDHLILLNDP